MKYEVIMQNPRKDANVREATTYVVEADGYERTDGGVLGEGVYKFFRGDVPVVSLRGVLAIGTASPRADADFPRVVGDPSMA